MLKAPDLTPVAAARRTVVPRTRAACATLLTALFLGAPLVAQETLGTGGTGGADGGGPGLVIVNLDLLDSRDGYAIPADSSFLPGETVHVYFQIAGYSVGEEYRVRLRYEVDALDPAGRPFSMAEGGEIDVELAPQDENWKPSVHYSPQIPDHAGGGSYNIQIAVTDELAGETIRTRLPINVDGDRILTSDELLVRDLRFSKSDGGDPLDEPEFEAGDQIWASFYITGYETAEDNTYDVESSAWVLDSDGDRMFQFESQGDAGNPYYPRLWLPAKFRLDLEETIPPGTYTVVLRLLDRIGDSAVVQRYPFRIR